MEPNEKYLIGYAILFAILIAAFLYIYRPKPLENLNSNNTNMAVNEYAVDPLNAIYEIEEDIVNLKNGAAEFSANPNSYTKIAVGTWNKQPAMGDLNSDDIADGVLILTYNPGGSGTFLYVVAALSDTTNKTTIGTNGIFLGDRIIPQDISIKDGIIRVNYLDRSADEPMAAEPTVKVSKYFKVLGNKLVEADIKSQEVHSTQSVPQGYSQNKYTVEKVLVDTNCELDSQCITPGEYLIQSRCPFTTKCLYNRCAVVCPMKK